MGWLYRALALATFGLASPIAAQQDPVIETSHIPDTIRIHAADRRLPSGPSFHIRAPDLDSVRYAILHRDSTIRRASLHARNGKVQGTIDNLTLTLWDAMRGSEDGQTEPFTARFFIHSGQRTDTASYPFTVHRPLRVDVERDRILTSDGIDSLAVFVDGTRVLIDEQGVGDYRFDPGQHPVRGTAFFETPRAQRQITAVAYKGAVSRRGHGVTVVPTAQDHTGLLLAAGWHEAKDRQAEMDGAPSLAPARAGYHGRVQFLHRRGESLYRLQGSLGDGRASVLASMSLGAREHEGRFHERRARLQMQEGRTEHAVRTLDAELLTGSRGMDNAARVYWLVGMRAVESDRMRLYPTVGTSLGGRMDLQESVPRLPSVIVGGSLDLRYPLTVWEDDAFSGDVELHVGSRNVETYMRIALTYHELPDGGRSQASIDLGLRALTSF